VPALTSKDLLTQLEIIDQIKDAERRMKRGKKVRPNMQSMMITNTKKKEPSLPNIVPGSSAGSYGSSTSSSKRLFFRKNKKGTRQTRQASFSTIRCKVAKLALPTLVRCILLLRETSLDLEGIFRVSGSSDVVKSLCADIENPNVFDGVLNQHNITGAFKMYLREQPNAIIPSRFYTPLMDAFRLTEPTEKLSKFSEIIQQIPARRYQILRVLMSFLYEVSTHSDENLMTTLNLGIIFSQATLQSDGFMNPLLVKEEGSLVSYMIENVATLLDPPLLTTEDYHDLLKVDASMRRASSAGRD